MAGLAIKIPKAKLIQELKDAIEKKKEKIKEIEAADEDFNKAMESFLKEVTQDIVKGKATITSFTNGGYFYSNSGRSLNVTVNFSKEKQFPQMNQKLTNGYVGQKRTYESQIREIENTIKLLEISDQEYVNGTTYKHVLRYL